MLYISKIVSSITNQHEDKDVDLEVVDPNSSLDHQLEVVHAHSASPWPIAPTNVQRDTKNHLILI